MGSIIDAKYKDKYKAGKDWLSTAIDKHCVKAETKEVTKVEKAEDGTETSTTEIKTLKSTRVDLDALFALAKANGFDVAKYEEQRDNPGAPGRLRMTIGNMLRAAAKKRHGLYLPMADGGGTEFVQADAAFIGDTAKTHNPDGSKIVAPKPDAAEEKAPADAEPEAA